MYNVHLTKQVHELSTKLSHLSDIVKEKSSDIVANIHDRKKEDTKEAFASQPSVDIQAKMDRLTKEMSAIRTDLKNLTETVQQQTTNQHTSHNQPIDDLPAPLHILRYVDDDADKKSFTEYVNETVRKKLSFAKSREYLLDNMPEHLRALVEEHPRLTKDLIRHQRSELKDN